MPFCRFHIVGGECNYLLRVTSAYSLEFVDSKDWMSSMMQSWTADSIRKLLDEAEAVLLNTAKHLRLPVRVGFRVDLLSDFAVLIIWLHLHLSQSSQ